MGTRRKPLVLIASRITEIPDGDILDGVFEPFIVSTSVDLVITTEDYVITKGAGGITITLIDPTDSTAKVVLVKNYSSSPIDVVADGAFPIDGHPEGFQVDPGSAFEFVPSEGEYYAF